ncbi:MAG: dUTP diphosphatase [candidate division WOR-3 bacterium]
MKPIKVKIKRLSDVPLPEYKTPGSVGLDIVAAENKVIKAKSSDIIKTGIAIELPPGVEGQIRPRSGLAAKFGIGVLNSPGTIDSDYRGEIKVILFNISKKDFLIKKGERIAQIVFSRTIPITWQEVQRLSQTKRGRGGFGSTGK